MLGPRSLTAIAAGFTDDNPKAQPNMRVITRAESVSTVLPWPLTCSWQVLITCPAGANAHPDYTMASQADYAKAGYVSHALLNLSVKNECHINIKINNKYTQTPIRARVCVCACAYACLFFGTHVCVCVCKRVIYVCICTCLCEVRVYIYIKYVGG